MLGVALALILAQQPGSAPSAGVTAADVMDEVVAGHRASDLDQRRQHMLAALELARRVPRDQLGPIVNFLAVAECTLSQMDRSEGRFAESLRRISRADRELEGLDPGWAAAVAIELGRALLEYGVVDLAEEPIRRALELARIDMEDGGDDNFSAWSNSYVALAKLYLCAGRYEEARRYLEDSLAGIDADFEARIGAARMSYLCGTLHLLAGVALVNIEGDASRSEAVEHFEAALAEDGLVESDRFAATCWRAILALRAGDLPAAAARLDRIDGELEAGSYRSIQPKDRFWLATARAQYALRARSGVEEAHEALLRAFGPVLEEQRESELETGASFLRYNRARWGMETLLSHGSAEEALALLIDSQASGVLWRGLGRPVPDLASVRSAFGGPGHACLVYVAGYERSFVFGFDRERLIRADLPSFDWIVERARTFVTALDRDPERLPPGLRKRREREIEATGAELAGALFPGAIRELVATCSRVSIVGRDQVGGLPFEALRVFDDEPLGWTHATSYLPSLPVGIALLTRSGRAREGGEFALLLGSRLGEAARNRFPGLPPVAPGEEELEELRAAVPGLRVVPAASADDLGRSGGLRALLLVAHGVRDLEGGLRPCLLLDAAPGCPDGVVDVDRIRGSRAPPLVLLAACRAAEGPERMGDEGAAHLGGAFLEAGAESVVLSAADVRLGASFRRSGRVLEGLADGISVAETLRLARRELGRSPDYHDPHHWALTFVYGLGE